MHDNGHAVLAPSAAARTVQCPYSVTAAAPFLNQPLTEEEQEGIVADMVARMYADRKNCFVGTSLIEGYPKITEEMIRGAVLWRDTIGMYCNQQIPVTVHRVHPQAWGSPDAWRWDPIERVMRVWDYKYGHLFVDVFECYQLLWYAIGALDVFDLFGDPDVRIELTIVQPRSYHRDGPVRTWPLTVGELRAYVNISEAAANEAMAPNPRAITGPECVHCPARGVCVAAQRDANRFAAYIGRNESLALPPAALGAELLFLLRAQEQLKARITGLEEQGKAYWRMGQMVPGFAMEPGSGNLAWNLPAEVLLPIFDAQGINIRKSDQPQLKTPTQVINDGAPTATVHQYSSRPTGESKFVLDDGKKAQKIFGGSKK